MAQITLNSTGVASSGALALQSNGTTTAVTIDTSQNVGIGTASPSVASGLGVVLNGGASQTRLAFKNTYTGDTSGDGVQFALISGQSAFVFQNRESDGNFSWETAGAERMRIDSSGNLLVGMTTYGVTTAGASLSPTASSSFYVAGGTALTIGRGTNDGTAVQFNRSGTNCGTISVTTTATAYNTSSDYRLKEAIAPMTGALAKVALLKPVTYKWKVDGSDGQGFIAHELAEIEAGCVTGEKDAVDADGNPQYQGIDTSFLVATLTAAIQELKALVDTQASTITTLTDRITALEAKP